MKPLKKPGVQNILMAAALVLPLLAPATVRAEADQGPGDGRGPGQQHEGPRGFGPEHGPGFGPGPGAGAGPMGPRFHGIKLSEEQDDKVFAILHDEEPYLREQFKVASKAQRALHELADADKYDDAKAAALATEAATAEANISLQHMRTQQKLLAVLTPEQRKQMAEDQPQHPPRP